MKRCVIIGASPLFNINLIRNTVTDNDFVIAVDGGYQTAVYAGIQPHFFIGDGDSNQFTPDIDKLILNTEKDNTDMQAATDFAIRKGYSDFIFLCCSGGRFDHHFANACLLERLAKNGVSGKMLDENNIIMVKSAGVQKLNRMLEYKYISIAALDEIVTGLTLYGFKYPLVNATLYRWEPYCISNEFIQDYGEIEIKSGTVFIIFSKD